MPASLQSAERTVAAIVAALRAVPASRPVENNVPVVSGLFLSWDEERADAAFDIRTLPDRAMRIEGRVDGAARWISLNLELGRVNLASGNILCMAADLEGTGEETALPVLCRSFYEAGAQDTVLNEGLTLPAGRRAQVALHRLGTADGATGGETNHTLIVLLPSRDFAFSVHDLRLLVVPAAASPDLGNTTLSRLPGL